MTHHFQVLQKEVDNIVEYIPIMSVIHHDTLNTPEHLNNLIIQCYQEYITVLLMAHI